MTEAELITKRLDGKIAVITGGNSGIRLATAQRFVQEGAYSQVDGRMSSIKQLSRLAEMSQGFRVTSQISQILTGYTRR